MPPVQRYPPQLQASRGRGSISRQASNATASGSGSKSYLLPDIPVEDFGPPSWRTPLNSRADLGYPDFYPSRPGYNQPEDVLTEENVKNGFTAKTFVAQTAESFSMHGPIHQHLLNGGLEKLNELGEQILAKRQESMPTIGERAFRIPVRVTYNDVKRQQFLSDLSNPLVPLHRLMRNPVPHGFKGVELLDAMFSPITTPPNRAVGAAQGPRPPADPVPVERAIWFIRVLGANEISAHRTRLQPSSQVAAAAPSPLPATPSSNNTTATAPPAPISSNAWYTQEFTNIFTSWMRLQLMQLALPAVNKGPAKQGAPKAAVGILGDEKARARWLAKWDYTTKLLSVLHTKYLISSRLFTAWLADHLLTANLAQAGFIAQLITVYISDMARNVVNGRSCTRAACEKIREIRSSPFSESVKKVDSTLCSLIQALIERQPEILFSPATWRANEPLLREILDETELPLDDYADRNKALLFSPRFTNDTSSPRRLQMQEIQKLDSMSSGTSMSDLCKSFFDGSASPTSTALDLDRFQDKVYILLGWAMSLFTLGVHRPYAICTLLKLWHDERTSYLAKGKGQSNIDVFPALYNWLDTSAPARNPSNVLAIGITFGELTRSGMFSYSRYIRTLIAQGKTARCAPEQMRSHHLGILRALPIFVEGKDLMYQRRIALSGDDWETRERDESEEQRQSEAFREEVQEYVPEIFGYKRWRRSASLRDSIDHQLSTPPFLNRYMFLQARFWLFTLCAEHLRPQAKVPAMDASTFARLLQLFRQCYGLSTTADLMLRAIKEAENADVVLMAMDTVVREADCWTANDRWSRIVDVLMDRLLHSAPTEMLHRRIANLLSELDTQGRLTKTEKKELRGAKEQIEKLAVVESGQHDASISMPVVEAAIKRGDATSAAALGEKLFSRHGPFSTWADLWWNTVVKAISAVPTQVAPGSHIDTVLAHVSAVDDKAGALDSTVTRWLDTLTPLAKVDILGHRSSLFLVILINLVTTRRITSLTILNKLVFPIWQTTSSACLLSRARQSGKAQAAVENSVMLAHQLLVSTGPHRHLPPATLEEAFILYSSRAQVLHDVNVPSLIRHLPFLVVLQYSPSILTKTHDIISNLLDSLAATAEFKTAAFRHLDLLKDAFLSSEWSKPSLDPGLETGMVDTLKLIMSESTGTDHKSTPPLLPVDSASRFSAWRWTGIVLGLRVEFKTLAGRIEGNDRPAEARETLALLVRQSLERDTSADDADLLCEAFRGIEPVVIQEIISAGLVRLSTLLSQMLSAESQHQLETIDKMVDLVLRIITSSTGAPESINLGNGPTGARHRFLDVISIALQTIETQLLADEEVHILGGLEPPQPGVLLRIVLRLLKFTLGLGRSEVNMLTTPRADFGKLATSFLRVIAALPSGVNVESLCDMVAFIVDSAPPQTRPALFTAYMAELPSAPIQAVFERNSSLALALPQVSPPRRPMALQTADASETIPLDDRPWEMFEQLAPLPRQLKHVEMFLASRPIRDTASVPMTLFNPQLKRDPLPVPNDQEEEWDLSVAERNLGDGQAGEALAAKQASTLLYAMPKDSIPSRSISTSDKDDGPRSTSSHTPKTESPSTPIPPIPSITPANRPRRSSTRTTKTGGSTKDAIDLEESSSDSDDDGIVVQPPPTKRPRVGSKSNASGSGSAAAVAAARPTVGGKAPAKRTTGGKGVARKATGGKNVGRKAPGGKAPKKR